MRHYDDYNEYRYGVMKWIGWETAGLDNVMEIASELQLSQDGYPCNYKHYWNDCLAMKMKAFNDLMECRDYKEVDASKLYLFLGRYALQEYREDDDR